MDAVDLLLAALAVVAGAVAALAGFGIGSLLTPAVGIAVGTKAAVAIVAVPHLVATALRLWALREFVDRRVLLSFGVASAAGGLLGALLHAAFSSPLLGITLGILLILGGVLELTGVGRQVELPDRLSTIAGLASGAFGGLVGNQGGIRSAALLRFGLSPQSLVATAAATAIRVDAMRIPVYLATSASDLAEHWTTVLALTAGAVVGTRIGGPILRRIPERRFRQLVAVTLIVLGIAVVGGVGR